MYNMPFQDDEEMYVIKRSGEREIVSFDKILQRVKNTGTEVGIQLNYTALTMKVIDQLYDGITTTQIDELTADQCASLSSTHPDYNILAGRLIISNHQKNTCANKLADGNLFRIVMTDLYENKDCHGKHVPLITKSLLDVVTKYENKICDAIDYKRDYLIDYFGFKL